MDASFFSHFRVFHRPEFWWFVFKWKYQFFRWFSTKLLDTVKYELIVLYLFMAASITDSSPKYEQICWTRRYLFVKRTKIWSLWIQSEKYTPSMKTLTKFTTQSCFVKQPNFLNNLLVCKLRKQTDLHLFTKTTENLETGY